MITSKNQKDYELEPLEEFDSTFGTPSTQKLFNVLVCWEKLPIKELIEKVGVSETHIYTILKKLEKYGIVEKESRGYYSLTQKKFTSLLKKAYTENLKEILGKELYRLMKSIEGENTEKSIFEFSELLEKWKPFLEKNFSNTLSTLGEYIIDEVVEFKK